MLCQIRSLRIMVMYHIYVYINCVPYTVFVVCLLWCVFMFFPAQDSQILQQLVPIFSAAFAWTLLQVGVHVIRDSGPQKVQQENHQKLSSLVNTYFKRIFQESNDIFWASAHRFGRKQLEEHWHYSDFIFALPALLGVCFITRQSPASPRLFKLWLNEQSHNGRAGFAWWENAHFILFTGS